MPAVSENITNLHQEFQFRKALDSIFSQDLSQQILMTTK